MPSPTSRTSPTSCDSTCWPNSLISFWRTRTISSASNRMAASREELILNRFEPGAKGGVDHQVADLQADAAEYGRVDPLDQDRLQVEPRPGHFLDFAAFGVAERHGREHLDPHRLRPLVHQFAIDRRHGADDLQPL